MIGAEDVVRLRPVGPVGRHGEPGAPPAELVIERCALVPRTSSEAADRSATVIVGYTLVCPPGTDLLATDQVRARGFVWEIEGEPGDFRDRRGKRKAVMAAIRRVKG